MLEEAMICMVGGCLHVLDVGSWATIVESVIDHQEQEGICFPYLHIYLKDFVVEIKYEVGPS